MRPDSKSDMERKVIVFCSTNHPNVVLAVLRGMQQPNPKASTAVQSFMTRMGIDLDSTEVLRLYKETLERQALKMGIG